MASGGTELIPYKCPNSPWKYAKTLGVITTIQSDKSPANT